MRTASFLHLRSVHAVQQLAVAARPTRGGQERVPRYLLGMRGRADGRVESLRGTWRSFHLLRGMGRPTGRSMPGKKTSCGTGRPGGVQRNPCAKPSKMNGICLGLACSGTQGPPEASGVPEPARRVPQNRAPHPDLSTCIRPTSDPLRHGHRLPRIRPGDLPTCIRPTCIR